MTNYLANLTTDALDAKTTALAGTYFLTGSLSGSGWAVLAGIVAVLPERTADEVSGRYHARAVAANASRLLALKPANFGA